MKGQGHWLMLFFLLLAGNSCYKNEPVPVAGFSYSGNNEFHAPCTVIFQNKSANAFSYEWDFGDDSVSCATDPVHTFTAAGSFTVKLRSYTESLKEWASTSAIVSIKP